jgi:hypothetical protein
MSSGVSSAMPSRHGSTRWRPARSLTRPGRIGVPLESVEADHTPPLSARLHRPRDGSRQHLRGEHAALEPAFGVGSSGIGPGVDR